ncbi:MAG: hypothetical protein CYPHOPRED_006077 [Cyphobasidiales sp. Tagirdzhanova-0007]|nr:MAG: hypothetical protein CYPHOPRED_006077 [Cyphobasidiales sp. Tagirdzhanova-0007]
MSISSAATASLCTSSGFSTCSGATRSTHSLSSAHPSHACTYIGPADSLDPATSGQTSRTVIHMRLVLTSALASRVEEARIARWTANMPAKSRREIVEAKFLDMDLRRKIDALLEGERRILDGLKGT